MQGLGVAREMVMGVKTAVGMEDGVKFVVMQQMVVKGGLVVDVVLVGVVLVMMVVALKL